VTARPIPGTQAQNKTLVALALHEPPATTLTLADSRTGHNRVVTVWPSGQVTPL